MLESEIFQIKFVEKFKTHILYSVTFFFRESRAVHEIRWEKIFRARQATDDNIIRRMRSACWITMAADSHPEICIIIALFHCNSGYSNASQCFVLQVAFRVLLYKHLLQSFTRHCSVWCGSCGTFHFCVTVKVALEWDVPLWCLCKQMSKKTPNRNCVLRWATCFGIPISHHQSQVKRK